jgi:exopolyphosphatase/guanosine-5'-triphosphate,3'-diphosphate pyrophosphatase
MESEKEMVRLGETGRDMKSLAPQAMDRGIDALRRFKSIISSRKAVVVKAVATSAVREAENRDLFIRRARAEAGIEIEVISGFEEGRLIYLGALQALPHFNKRALLIDIGGGSAEYVLGLKGEVKFVNSLKLGAIRLSHQFRLLGQPKPQDILDCRKMIVGELGMSARSIRNAGFDVGVGTSGTVQAIASIIGHARPEKVETQAGKSNNFTFSYREVQETVEKLIGAGSAEARMKIPGLDQKRADIILGGALVLQESMRLLGMPEIATSSFALREGVVFDQIQTHLRKSNSDITELHDIRERSVRQLGDRTNYERTHADQVAKLAIEIFDRTQRLHKLNKEARGYLYYASLLHDIGYYISHSEHHKHSYYIVSHAELLGFTNEEIEIIANVARYHRKSHPKLKHEGFQKLTSDEHREIVRMLSGILRIADGLDRGHLGLVDHVGMTTDRNGVTFSAVPKRGAPRNLELELWGAERKKQLFEEVFGKAVTLKDLTPASKRKISIPVTVQIANTVQNIKRIVPKGKDNAERKSDKALRRR